MLNAKWQKMNSFNEWKFFHNILLFLTGVTRVTRRK